MPEPTTMPAGNYDRFEHHMVAGAELLRQNRVQDAQRELTTALEARPGAPRALALLGLAYFRGGQFAEARPIYEQLVAQQPDDAAYHLNLGLVHLKLGDAEAAIASLSRSRDLDPSQGKAVSYLGLAYARAGRFAEAYQAFQIAGQSDLAHEIENNLSPEVRADIDAQLRRAKASAPTVAPPMGRKRASVVVPEPAAVAVPAATPAGGRDADDADADGDVLELVAAPSSGDSGSFVMPLPDQPVPQLVDEATSTATTGRRPRAFTSAISQAVALAKPSQAAAAAEVTRIAAGSRPPQPLSEFATARLVRPEDGDHPFEISAGGVLIVRVRDRMFTRTEGVDVTGGTLTYEPAARRSRGASIGEPFATGDRQMFQVSGNGHLIAAPAGGHFTAVVLDDDIFYLREDLVFAFEPALRWENGHVPGSRARLHMVQFRGAGAVAFRTPRPLLAVKLAPERVLYVDATALAGWIGRVVPRAVAPAGGGKHSELFVECSGEGVVLVQEETGVPAATPPGLAAETDPEPEPEPAVDADAERAEPTKSAELAELAELAGG